VLKTRRRRQSISLLYVRESVVGCVEVAKFSGASAQPIRSAIHILCGKYRLTATEDAPAKRLA